MAIKPVEILITAKDRASAVFGSLKATAIAAGVAIAGYFGVRVFAGAVQGAAELEAKLSEVRAVSGATADEMQRLRAAAEQAGATTKFTATEAAGALGNLSRAGLNAQQSIAALPGTLALAQAGNIALEESASIVTKALAGFGLEADKSGLVADVLAKGANSANTNVLGLAQALSYAAPTAQGLGLSLETTVAIIGKFADAGIDASRAGTALNAILAQFSDPASRFRRELAAIGITTNDFEQALREMAAAGPGAQKALLAVGTEAGPALRALLSQGIGAFDELRNKLLDAEGAARQTADTMDNNLQGAARGLSSAWDAVKNTLGTPVLPVLKDGVQQLTAALRNAVSDGTVGRFGEAIASGFRAGLEWARAFLAEVDFGALATRASSAADQVGAAFDSLASKARTAGDLVRLVWGVMTAGANGVMTAVYTVAEAFSGVASNVQSGIALILDGLSRITFGGVSAAFAQAAAEVRLSAEATWAATEALADKGRESFVAMADGAELARTGWAGLTADTSEATKQAATANKVFKDVASTLEEVGGATDAAGQKARANAIIQAEESRKVRAEVAALRNEYEAALKAGDVQVAAEKLQLIQRLLRGVSGQAKVTKEDVQAAFRDVGISTKQELDEAAEKAKRNFEIIKGSGLATSDGLQQAFKVMAEAVIAANGGVASETIKAQAAMYGLEVAVDAAGKAIIRSISTGKDQVDDFKNSVDGATRSLEKLAEAERKRKGVDKDGFSVNSSGQRIQGFGQSRESIEQQLTAAGIDPATARTQAEYLNRIYQGEITAAQGMRGSTGGIIGDQSGLEMSRFTAAMNQALASAAAPTVGRTVAVNINTGSGTETVNTDDAGAQAVIRALGAAARRAGR